MKQLRSEAAAVAERYKRRNVGDLYSMLRSEVMLSHQERQTALLRLFRKNAPAPLQELRVLEVGCGTGRNLLELIQLGFAPWNLVGNELLAERAKRARRTLPESTKILEGDAVCLPIERSSFDVVYASTVFSSLLDDDFQQQLANRMWNWLRPGGSVLWYDFVYDNPNNPDVRGVPIRRIKSLFPGKIIVKKITLAPPISRLVCRVHPAGYRFFNLFPFLRTHVLCWITKGSNDPHV